MTQSAVDVDCGQPALVKLADSRIGPWLALFIFGGLVTVQMSGIGPSRVAVYEAVKNNESILDDLSDDVNALRAEKEELRRTMDLIGNRLLRIEKKLDKLTSQE